MDDYPTKPFRGESLATLVSRWTEPDSSGKRLQGTRLLEAAMTEKATVLIDRRMLDAIRQLDDSSGSLLARVVQVYLDSSPQLIGRLRHGFDRDDLELLRHAAHTLKSSSANLGAAQLAELCKRIEFAARSGSLTPDTPRAEEIEAEFRRVQAALEAELKGAAA
jgi:HPt (histidine-containing phosphotransfer) domain-containing protein